MKGLTNLLLTIVVMSALYTESRAQTQEILGGNLLNGAITGSLLGAATMGLQNNDDFAPLRIGLGAGILGGVGIAFYDMASRPESGHLYVSGFINNGHNSSIIILLDTLYGTAGGALIGTAGMLIADRRVAEGLQYGASAGAWAGFAFGLFDAFFLADRNQGRAAQWPNRESLIELAHGNYHVGVLHPSLYLMPEAKNGSIRHQIEPGIGFLAFRMRF